MIKLKVKQIEWLNSLYYIFIIRATKAAVPIPLQKFSMVIVKKIIIKFCISKILNGIKAGLKELQNPKN